MRPLRRCIEFDIRPYDGEPLTGRDIVGVGSAQTNNLAHPIEAGAVCAVCGGSASVSAGVALKLSLRPWT